MPPKNKKAEKAKAVPLEASPPARRAFAQTFETASLGGQDKIVEDRTFGLKNKNKSKQVQK